MTKIHKPPTSISGISPPVLREKEPDWDSIDASAIAVINENAWHEGNTSIAKKGIFAEPSPYGDFDHTLPPSGETGY